MKSSELLLSTVKLEDRRSEAPAHFPEAMHVPRATAILGFVEVTDGHQRQPS
jgi:hypothetical protein